MAPTVGDVNRIAAVQDPVIRNLQITACYHELSAALSSRTGSTANWCTFATWASRQAGQTIRREDLRRKLEAALHLDPEVAAQITVMARMLWQINQRISLEHIRATAIQQLVTETSIRASDAIARGNRKVFAEIGLEFARFIEQRTNDSAYSLSAIDAFCEQLRPGDPPDGQQYLRNAFRRYYRSFFEEDLKKASEMRFLANVEIGFHEQTRLQPEIAEALNAAAVDRAQLKKTINDLLRPSDNGSNKFMRWIRSLVRETGVSDLYIDSLADLAESTMRKLLTAHLMTLTFPPGKALLLGRDLSVKYPEHLLRLEDPETRQLLSLVDPTADSLAATGATDWSDLKERMHFICDLFRCYHESAVLFEPAFTQDQIENIAAGRVPAYFDW